MMYATGQVLARVLATTLVVAVLASCGGKDDESAAEQSKAAAAQAQAKRPKRDPADDRMAAAVSVGKTDRIAGLRYDLAARPAAGQPFEIELEVTPQSPADTIVVESQGMQGLDVVAGGSAAFQNVTAGQAYKTKLLAQPSLDGLYYLSITVKLTSKVQSESARFSVPVVVAPVQGKGKPAAAGAAPAGSVGTAGANALSGASSEATASSSGEAGAKPAAPGN